MAVHPALYRPQLNFAHTASPVAGEAGSGVALLHRVPAYEPAHEQAPWPAAAVTVVPVPVPVPTRTRSAAAAPQPHPDQVSPAALVRAQQVFRLTFEVLEGRRGPKQLEHVMAAELVAKVTTMARAYVTQRVRTTTRLHRVHVQQVTPRAAEACVAVEQGARVHAVAARLELEKGGWRCTALRIG